MVLVGWEKVFAPKCAGGLGIRRIKLLDKALVAKLGWNFLEGTKDWVKILKANTLEIEIRVVSSLLPTCIMVLSFGIT